MIMPAQSRGIAKYAELHSIFRLKLFLDRLPFRFRGKTDRARHDPAQRLSAEIAWSQAYAWVIAQSLHFTALGRGKNIQLLSALSEPDRCDNRSAALAEGGQGYELLPLKRIER